MAVVDDTPKSDDTKKTKKPAAVPTAPSKMQVWFPGASRLRKEN